MVAKKVFTAVVVLSMFASFCLAEEISIPTLSKTTPAPNRVNGGRVEVFVAAAVSSEGHALEYQFTWGDGNVGPWGAATQTHVYTYGGAGVSKPDHYTYSVTVQARCATDTDVVSELSSPLVLTSEPVKSTASFYANWVFFNRPDCWACQRNCRGDANCRSSGFGIHRQWIDPGDLAILAAAFNKVEAQLMVCSVDGIPCICADNNRAYSGFGATKVWVNSADLSTIVPYWLKTEASVPPCPQTNYHYWTN